VGPDIKSSKSANIQQTQNMVVDARTRLVMDVLHRDSNVAAQHPKQKDTVALCVPKLNAGNNVR
jgi:hypothetical protein